MEIDRAHLELRRAVRRECRRQLEALFRLEAEGDCTMLDVLTAHVGLGYGVNVGVSVRHPNEAGRAEEDPEPEKPLLEVVSR